MNSDKRERAKKIADIIDSEAGEIVKELKRKQSSVSKEEIIDASIKRQEIIVSQLREAGLGNKEISQKLSWVGRIVLIKLKKEMGEDAIRGMAVDELDGGTSSNVMAKHIKRVSKEEKISTDSARKKLSRFHRELKFREQLIKEIEKSIYEMTGIQYEVESAIKQYMTLEKPFSVTGKCSGGNYDVILKEITPKNFYDPLVLKVAKYMGINTYKINIFKIRNLKDVSKHYAVIEKVPGRNIIYLKMNPRYIKGLERQYLEELGKLVAFTYVCAIPDRTSDNIICDKTGYEIKLTTFDFAMSFDYKKYSPLKVALFALDMNTSFLKDIALRNKDALKRGFLAAFNSAKKNESKILKNVVELKKDSASDIKKILEEEPERIFDELTGKSKFFS